ncbi:MAG: alpha/beta fold hydrolase, partial [Nocardioidaceae bacterium]
FGSLHSAARVVPATDGVALNVEVDDPETGGAETGGAETGDEGAGSPAVPTVVFVHGWVLDMDSWHYQRAALRGRTRLVFYDQRSHGGSGRSDPGHCNLEQLGVDLRSVLDAVVPDGPIVLVGHSMGGMTIMSLAAQFPEVVADRVVGVVLCATSAGELISKRAPLSRLQPVLSRLSYLVDQGRKLNSYAITRRYAVGPDAPEKYADMADEMIGRAPTHLLWDFYPNFVGLDFYTALEALPGKHTVVIAGTEDVLTPMRHSRRMSELVDGSELVACEGSGHMVMLEEHETVSRAVLDLLEDVAG